MPSNRLIDGNLELGFGDCAATGVGNRERKITLDRSVAGNFAPSMTAIGTPASNTNGGRAPSTGGSFVGIFVNFRLLPVGVV